MVDSSSFDTTTGISPPPRANHIKLRTMVQNKYGGSIKEGLRLHLQREPAWRRAMQFLDQEGGWDLLEAMIRSKDVTREDDPYSLCPALLASKFLQC